MKKLSFFLLALITFTLQGCFFAAGAAVGAAAIAVVYDHRNLDSILQDQRIDREILRRIHDNPELHAKTHISVTSFGQVVLLTGEAPTADLRHKAEETAWTVPGIKRIYNAIAIQEPTSTFSQTNDAWITAKIKTELLAASGLKSASIKVVTENGAVYLMGTLTREQAQRVVDIARHTTGVQKVVKIFQYEEENAPAPVSAPPPATEAQPSQSSSQPQKADVVSSVETHPVDDSQPLIQG